MGDDLINPEKKEPSREEDGLANSRPAMENEKRLAVEGKAVAAINKTTIQDEPSTDADHHKEQWETAVKATLKRESSAMYWLWAAPAVVVVAMLLGFLYDSFQRHGK